MYHHQNLSELLLKITVMFPPKFRMCPETVHSNTIVPVGGGGGIYIKDCQSMVTKSVSCFIQLIREVVSFEHH
jgi:hypothetical protein